MKNKTGRTVLFVVLALAVIAGAVVGILYVNKKNTPEPVGIGIEIDPSSGTFVAPEKKESDDKDERRSPCTGSEERGEAVLGADKGAV